MRLPPPPDSATAPSDLQAVRAAVSGADTNALEKVAYWDAGSPAYQWMTAASNQLLTRNIGGPASTRAIALVSVAIYDSMVAAWDGKYAYNRPRPNAADPTLQPLPVPRTNSPSYPSEHAVVAGAAAVLT